MAIKQGMKMPKPVEQVEVSDAEYARAVEAGQSRAASAQSVRFHRPSKRLQIELQDGVAVLIPIALIQGLGEARVSEIENIEVLADGYALSWPSLDVDVTVAGLVEGVFGTQRWMRQLASGFLSAAGRKGGKSSSRAKSKAARANGKLGGRPRKKVIA